MPDFGRWLKMGIFSIIEYGLFSVTSLVTGIWVARALGPDAYGAYAIATGLIILLVAVHHALVAEPMMVLASTRFADRSGDYLRTVAATHVRAAPMLTAVLLVATCFASLGGNARLTHAMLGVALSLAPILLMTAMRRSASAELRAGRAAIGAAFHLATTAAVLALLARTDHLTIFSALATSGIASLVAAGIYALGLPSGSGTRLPIREIAREHWRYGQPGIVAGVLAWVPHNIYILVLPLLARTGLGASADLRAAMNFVSPAFQINGALGIVLIPILAARHRVARLDVRQLAPFFAVFLAVDTLLLLVLAAGGDRLVPLAYGDGYPGTVKILHLLAFVPLITGASTVVRAWAFALEYPEAQLWASVAGAVGALFGVATLSTWPLEGAAIGMLLAHGAYLAVVTLLVSRRARATLAGDS